MSYISSILSCPSFSFSTQCISHCEVFIGRDSIGNKDQASTNLHVIVNICSTLWLLMFVINSTWNYKWHYFHIFRSYIYRILDGFPYVGHLTLVSPMMFPTIYGVSLHVQMCFLAWTSPLLEIWWDIGHTSFIDSWKRRVIVRSV